MSTRRLKLLSANIQAGSSTRGYHDYFARSWSHVLPAGNKRGALDTIAQLAAQHDIVGLEESDPGSLPVRATAGHARAHVDGPEPGAQERTCG